MLPTTVRPNNPPITPPAIDPAFVPVAPVLTGISGDGGTNIIIACRENIAERVQAADRCGGSWNINDLSDCLMEIMKHLFGRAKVGA